MCRTVATEVPLKAYYARDGLSLPGQSYAITSTAPHSAIAVLALTLTATHTIPVSSVALVLGVHSVLSAAFVFTNIAGNCVATLVVAKWEEAVDRAQLQTELDAGYQAA